MSNVRRVELTSYGYEKIIENEQGTHALMPWSRHLNREMLLTKALDENKRMSAEIERLRRLMLIVDEMVGEDIKAYCSEQTNREWQNVVRELEESDGT